LLSGARVHPARLLSCGHKWRYPTLSEALEFEV
jgi:NAD dependent epimerase/dehydratase family enzyme